jgi:hypothetical protein
MMGKVAGGHHRGDHIIGDWARPADQRPIKPMALPSMRLHKLPDKPPIA